MHEFQQESCERRHLGERQSFTFCGISSQSCPELDTISHPKPPVELSWHVLANCHRTYNTALQGNVERIQATSQVVSLFSGNSKQSGLKAWDRVKAKTRKKVHPPGVDQKQGKWRKESKVMVTPQCNRLHKAGNAAAILPEGKCGLKPQGDGNVASSAHVFSIHLGGGTVAAAGI